MRVNREVATDLALAAGLVLGTVIVTQGLLSSVHDYGRGESARQVDVGLPTHAIPLAIETSPHTEIAP